MAKFCGKCGSPLNDTAVFCGGCGAQVPPSPVSSAPVPPAPAPMQSQTGAAQPAPAFSPVPEYVPGQAGGAPAKKSNTLLKVIVALVVLIFLGGALALGGLWYAAQKINAKAKAVAARSPGLSAVAGSLGGLMSSAGNDDSSTEFKGDPCRFLSTQEVSQAVGVTIIRAEGEDNVCRYIARGDIADMKAKHIAGMVNGIDAKTQKTVTDIAGGFFSAVAPHDESGATQEVQVLIIDLEVGHAGLAMKANRKAFGYVGGGGGSASSSGTGDLDGIGDEAYVAGGGMLMVRKGDTVARFAYTGCPCSTDNIKPLAKLAVSRL